MASLLGAQVERINLSGNSSMDQLMGSLVPVVLDGSRVFQFQAGKLLLALRAHSWVLLDEVNLGPPELLEGLTPCLEGDSIEDPEHGTALDVRGARIFATQNPALIGGGRVKLPRGVRNLLTSVKLAPYSDAELYSILSAKARPLISAGELSEELLKRLFAVHVKVRDQCADRTIGRHGASGSLEYNLRDLFRLLDVIQENAKDQQAALGAAMQHSPLAAAQPSQDAEVTEIWVNGEQLPAIDRDDPRLVGLRHFVELTYAASFKQPEDVDAVRAIIDSILPLPAAFRGLGAAHTVDESPSMVRVGTAYIRKRDSTEAAATPSLLPPLVHTASTVRTLAQLAAAVQSKRAVLLEGDTASGKTALACELARLCNQDMLLWSLNQDTEVADLIGSWLPVHTVENAHGLAGPVERLYQLTFNHILYRNIPQLHKPEQRAKVVSQLVELNALRFPESDLSRAAPRRPPQDDKSSLVALIQLLGELRHCDGVDLEAQLENNRKKTQLEDMAVRLQPFVDRWLADVAAQQQQQAEDGQVARVRRAEMSFIFVESAFVRAIRSGRWVLLDNIAAAPAEVVERLNSLLEEEPTLNITERGAGQTLTLADGSIHASFRLFLTANVLRQSSNKLSGALLNRTIRIWLQPIDTVSDALQLVEHGLGGVSGGAVLSRLVLDFHLAAQSLVRAGDIKLMDSMAFTWRSVERVVGTVLHLLQRKARPASNAVNGLSITLWALLHHYCGALAGTQYRANLLRLAAKLLDESSFAQLSYPRLPPTQARLTELEMDYASRVQPVQLAVEYHTLHLCFNVLAASCQSNIAVQGAKQICDAIACLLAAICQDNADIAQHLRALVDTRIPAAAATAASAGSADGGAELLTAIGRELYGLFQLLREDRINEWSAVSGSRPTTAAPLPDSQLTEAARQADALNQACLELESSLMDPLVRRASLHDAAARERMLHSLLCGVGELHTALSLCQSAAGVSDLMGQQLRRALSSLQRLLDGGRRLLSFFLCFHSCDLLSLLRQLVRQADVAQVRASLFPYESSLSKPLYDNYRVSRALVSSLLASTASLDVQLLQTFQTQLDWLGCRWSHFLSFPSWSLFATVERQPVTLPVLRDLHLLQTAAELSARFNRCLMLVWQCVQGSNVWAVLAAEVDQLVNGPELQFAHRALAEQTYHSQADLLGLVQPIVLRAIATHRKRKDERSEYEWLQRLQLSKELRQQTALLSQPVALFWLNWFTLPPIQPQRLHLVSLSAQRSVVQVLTSAWSDRSEDGKLYVEGGDWLVLLLHDGTSPHLSVGAVQWAQVQDSGRSEMQLYVYHLPSEAPAQEKAAHREWWQRAEDDLRSRGGCRVAARTMFARQRGPAEPDAPRHLSETEVSAIEQVLGVKQSLYPRYAGSLSLDDAYSRYQRVRLLVQPSGPPPVSSGSTLSSPAVFLQQLLKDVGRLQLVVQSRQSQLPQTLPDFLNAVARRFIPAHASQWQQRYSARLAEVVPTEPPLCAALKLFLERLPHETQGWTVSSELRARLEQSLQGAADREQVRLWGQWSSLVARWSTLLDFCTQFVHRACQEPATTTLVYDSTPSFIQRLTEWDAELLRRTVDMQQGERLVVLQSRPARYWEELQAAANSHLQMMGVSASTLHSNGISSLFLDGLLQFSKAEDVARPAASPPASSVWQSPVRRVLQRVEHAMRTIEELLGRAKACHPPPLHIVSPLVVLSVKLEKAKEEMMRTQSLDSDSEIRLLLLLTQPRELQRQLNEYHRQLSQSDPFMAKIAALLKEANFLFTLQHDAFHIDESVLAATTTPPPTPSDEALKKCSDRWTTLSRKLDLEGDTHEFAATDPLSNVGLLLTLSTESASWQEAAALCLWATAAATASHGAQPPVPAGARMAQQLFTHQRAAGGDTDEQQQQQQRAWDAVYSRFRALVRVLSRPVSRRLESLHLEGSGAQESMLDAREPFLQELSNFQASLLQPARLPLYDQQWATAEFQPVAMRIESYQPNLLSVYTLLQHSQQRASTIRKHLRGHVVGVECVLEPLHLGPAQLMAHFMPEQLQVFLALLQRQKDAEQAKSAGRLALGDTGPLVLQISPPPQPPLVGLASFAYSTASSGRLPVLSAHLPHQLLSALHHVFESLFGSFVSSVHQPYLYRHDDFLPSQLAYSWLLLLIPAAALSCLDKRVADHIRLCYVDKELQPMQDELALLTVQAAHTKTEAAAAALVRTKLEDEVRRRQELHSELVINHAHELIRSGPSTASILYDKRIRDASQLWSGAREAVDKHDREQERARDVKRQLDEKTSALSAAQSRVNAKVLEDVEEHLVRLFDRRKTLLARLQWLLLGGEVQQEARPHRPHEESDEKEPAMPAHATSHSHSAAAQPDNSSSSSSSSSFFFFFTVLSEESSQVATLVQQLSAAQYKWDGGDKAGLMEWLGECQQLIRASQDALKELRGKFTEEDAVGQCLGFLISSFHAGLTLLRQQVGFSWECYTSFMAASSGSTRTHDADTMAAMSRLQQAVLSSVSQLIRLALTLQPPQHLVDACWECLELARRVESAVLQVSATSKLDPRRQTLRDVRRFIVQAIVLVHRFTISQRPVGSGFDAMLSKLAELDRDSSASLPTVESEVRSTLEDWLLLVPSVSASLLHTLPQVAYGHTTSAYAMTEDIHSRVQRLSEACQLPSYLLQKLHELLGLVLGGLLVARSEPAVAAGQRQQRPRVHYTATEHVSAAEVQGAIAVLEHVEALCVPVTSASCTGELERLATSEELSGLSQPMEAWVALLISRRPGLDKVAQDLVLAVGLLNKHVLFSAMHSLSGRFQESVRAIQPVSRRLDRVPLGELFDLALSPPVPRWTQFRLSDVLDLTLLEQTLTTKVRSAADPSELDMSDALVRAHFGVFHDSLVFISSSMGDAGQLLGALFEICPTSLRISKLIERFRQQCDSALQLFGLPLESVSDHSAPDHSSRLRPSQPGSILEELTRHEQFVFGLLNSQIIEEIGRTLTAAAAAAAAAAPPLAAAVPAVPAVPEHASSNAPPISAAAAVRPAPVDRAPLPCAPTRPPFILSDDAVLFDEVSREQYFRLSRVAGDGRCQWRSVARGLVGKQRAELEEVEAINWLRTSTCTFLDTDSNAQRLPVPYQPRDQRDQLISQYRGSHDWGGDASLIVMSHLVGRPINVWELAEGSADLSPRAAVYRNTTHGAAAARLSRSVPISCSPGAKMFGANDYSIAEPVHVLYTGNSHYDLLLPLTDEQVGQWRLWEKQAEQEAMAALYAVSLPVTVTVAAQSSSSSSEQHARPAKTAPPVVVLVTVPASRTGEWSAVDQLDSVSQVAGDMERRLHDISNRVLDERRAVRRNRANRRMEEAKAAYARFQLRERSLEVQYKAAGSKFEQDQQSVEIWIGLLLQVDILHTALWHRQQSDLKWVGADVSQASTAEQLLVDAIVVAPDLKPVKARFDKWMADTVVRAPRKVTFHVQAQRLNSRVEVRQLWWNYKVEMKLTLMHRHSETVLNRVMNMIATSDTVTFDGLTKETPCTLTVEEPTEAKVVLSIIFQDKTQGVWTIDYDTIVQHVHSSHPMQFSDTRIQVSVKVTEYESLERVVPLPPDAHYDEDAGVEAVRQVDEHLNQLRTVVLGMRRPVKPVSDPFPDITPEQVAQLDTTEADNEDDRRALLASPLYSLFSQTTAATHRCSQLVHDQLRISQELAAEYRRLYQSDAGPGQALDAYRALLLLFKRLGDAVAVCASARREWDAKSLAGAFEALIKRYGGSRAVTEADEGATEGRAIDSFWTEDGKRLVHSLFSDVLAVVERCLSENSFMFLQAAALTNCLLASSISQEAEYRLMPAASELSGRVEQCNVVLLRRQKRFGLMMISKLQKRIELVLSRKRSQLDKLARAQQLTQSAAEQQQQQDPAPVGPGASSPINPLSVQLSGDCTLVVTKDDNQLRLLPSVVVVDFDALLLSSTSDGSKPAVRTLRVINQEGSLHHLNISAVTMTNGSGAEFTVLPGSSLHLPATGSEIHCCMATVQRGAFRGYFTVTLQGAPNQPAVTARVVLKASVQRLSVNFTWLDGRHPPRARRLHFNEERRATRPLSFGRLLNDSSHSLTWRLQLRNCTGVPFLVKSAVLIAGQSSSVVPPGYAQFDVEPSKCPLRLRSSTELRVTCTPSWADMSFEHASLVVGLGQGGEVSLFTIPLKVSVRRPVFDITYCGRALGGNSGLHQAQMPMLEVELGSSVTEELVVLNSGKVPVDLTCSSSNSDMLTLLEAERVLVQPACSARVSVILHGCTAGTQRVALILHVVGAMTPASLPAFTVYFHLSCGTRSLEVVQPSQFVLDLTSDSRHTFVPATGLYLASGQLQFRSTGNLTVQLSLADNLAFRAVGSAPSSVKLLPGATLDWPLQVPSSEEGTAGVCPVHSNIGSLPQIDCQYTVLVRAPRVELQPRATLHFERYAVRANSPVEKASLTLHNIGPVDAEVSIAFVQPPTGHALHMLTVHLRFADLSLQPLSPRNTDGPLGHSNNFILGGLDTMKAGEKATLIVVATISSQVGPFVHPIEVRVRNARTAQRSDAGWRSEPVLYTVRLTGEVLADDSNEELKEKKEETEKAAEPIKPPVFPTVDATKAAPTDADAVLPAAMIAGLANGVQVNSAPLSAIPNIVQRFRAAATEAAAGRPAATTSLADGTGADDRALLVTESVASLEAAISAGAASPTQLMDAVFDSMRPLVRTGGQALFDQLREALTNAESQPAAALPQVASALQDLMPSTASAGQLQAAADTLNSTVGSAEWRRGLSSDHVIRSAVAVARDLLGESPAVQQSALSVLELLSDVEAAQDPLAAASAALGSELYPQGPDVDSARRLLSSAQAGSANRLVIAGLVESLAARGGSAASAGAVIRQLTQNEPVHTAGLVSLTGGALLNAVPHDSVESRVQLSDALGAVERLTESSSSAAPLSGNEQVFHALNVGLRPAHPRLADAVTSLVTEWPSSPRTAAQVVHRVAVVVGQMSPPLAGLIDGVMNAVQASRGAPLQMSMLEQLAQASGLPVTAEQLLALSHMLPSPSPSLPAAEAISRVLDAVEQLLPNIPDVSAQALRAVPDALNALQRLAGAVGRGEVSPAAVLDELSALSSAVGLPSPARVLTGVAQLARGELNTEQVVDALFQVAEGALDHLPPQVRHIPAAIRALADVDNVEDLVDTLERVIVPFLPPAVADIVADVRGAAQLVLGLVDDGRRDPSLAVDPVQLLEAALPLIARHLPDEVQRALKVATKVAKVAKDFYDAVKSGASLATAAGAGLAFVAVLVEVLPIPAEIKAKVQAVLSVAMGVLALLAATNPITAALAVLGVVMGLANLFGGLFGGPGSGKGKGGNGDGTPGQSGDPGCGTVGPNGTPGQGGTPGQTGTPSNTGGASGSNGSGATPGSSPQGSAGTAGGSTPGQQTAASTGGTAQPSPTSQPEAAAQAGTGQTGATAAGQRGHSVADPTVRSSPSPPRSPAPPSRERFSPQPSHHSVQPQTQAQGPQPQQDAAVSAVTTGRPPPTKTPQADRTATPPNPAQQREAAATNAAAAAATAGSDDADRATAAQDDLTVRPVTARPASIQSDRAAVSPPPAAPDGQRVGSGPAAASGGPEDGDGDDDDDEGDDDDDDEGKDEAANDGSDSGEDADDVDDDGTRDGGGDEERHEHADADGRRSPAPSPHPSQFDSEHEEQDQDEDEALSDSETAAWRMLVTRMEQQLAEVSALLRPSGSAAGTSASLNQKQGNVAGMLNASKLLSQLARSFVSSFHRAVGLSKLGRLFSEPSFAQRYVQQGIHAAALIETIQIDLERFGFASLPSSLASERKQLRRLLSLIPPASLSPAALRLWTQLRLGEDEEAEALKDFAMPRQLLAEGQPPLPESEPDDDQTVYRFTVGTAQLAPIPVDEPKDEYASMDGWDGASQHAALNASEPDEHTLPIRAGVTFDFSEQQLDTVSDDDLPDTSQPPPGPLVPRPAELEAASAFARSKQRERVRSSGSGGRLAPPSGSVEQADPLSRKHQVSMEAPDEDAKQLVANLGGVQPRINMEQAAIARLFTGRAKATADSYSGSIPAALPQYDVPVGRWTYARLVECVPLAKMINDVLHRMRSEFEQSYSSSSEVHEYEICLLMDDSGSAALVQHELMEALVLCMESLRKLEVAFSVACFSTKARTRILKEFDQPMTVKRGEQILASFSFNHGTFPASCLRHVAERLWPKLSRPRQPQQQRVVIMMTDGFTNEAFMSDYGSVTEEYGVKLNIMFLHPDGLPVVQANVMQNLDTTAAKAAKIQVVNVIAKADLCLHTHHVLTNLFAAAHDPAQAGASGAQAGPAVTARQKFLATVSKADMASTKPVPVVEQLGSLTFAQLESQGSIPLTAFSSRFRVSGQRCALPFDALLLGAAHRQRELTQLHFDDESDFQHVHATTAELYDQLASADMRPALQKAEADVAAALQKVQAVQTELVTVMRDQLFPDNKHTRRKGDTSGSSLYLPGLIKAVISGWQYKKFMSTISAGGKREYSVCVAIDTSYSMHGHLEVCLLESVLLFLSGLHQLGFDHFTVLTFGEKVRVLKTEVQPWDAAAMYVLLRQVKCKQYATRDAVAVELGTLLLRLSAARGPKKLFVFTDGYSSQGMRLTAALKAANEADVEVTGISVGFDRSFVAGCYQRWVTAALPSALPEALSQLYQVDDEALAGPSSTDDEKRAAERAAERVMLMVDGADEKTAAVWKEHNTDAFRQLGHKLHQVTEQQFKDGGDHLPSNFVVDVAFVVDCTGSMKAYLGHCKAQMADIATALTSQLKTLFPSMQFTTRYALLPFRDFGQPMEATDFVDEGPQTNTAFTSGVAALTATGGADEAEDVLGALERSLKLKWKGKNRYVVFMGDGPGHGPELNPNPSQRASDDQPTYKALLCKDVMKRLVGKGIDLFFCRIRPSLTDAMEACFRTHFDYEDRKMQSLTLFDEVAPPKLHIIFCLDDSLSMLRDWRRLLDSFRSFLNMRVADQAVHDLVSVIQFSHTAELICDAEPVSTVSRNLDIRGGGTCYNPALLLVQEQLKRAEGTHRSLVVFMSDGGNGSEPDRQLPVRTLTDMYRDAASPFDYYSVAFGQEQPASKFAVLKDMAVAAGKTVETGFRLAKDDLELLKQFTAIAQSCSPTEALVVGATRTIADDVFRKITPEVL